jgi:hypothetical protein
MGAKWTGRFSSRRLAIIILLVAGLIGWFAREFLMQKTADLWIVSDPLTHTDASIVLGGNSQARPVAADLYRRSVGLSFRLPA